MSDADTSYTLVKIISTHICALPVSSPLLGIALGLPRVPPRDGEILAADCSCEATAPLILPRQQDKVTCESEVLAALRPLPSLEHLLATSLSRWQEDREVQDRTSILWQTHVTYLSASCFENQRWEKAYHQMQPNQANPSQNLAKSS